MNEEQANTFLMQIRDNTYWANEHSRDRHIELVFLLKSIKTWLIINTAAILGVGLAVGLARH
jgi:hypothetical protein